MRHNRSFVLIILVFLISTCKKPGNEIKSLLTEGSTPERYRDSVFSYSQLDITSNIVYRRAGNTDDYDANEPYQQNLALDIYEPKRTIDTVVLRPLIIWMHGGGYEGGDKAGAPDIISLKKFASRGYVVASINYRLSQNSLCSRRENVTLSELIVTIYRTVQDARFAVRYIKSRAHEANIDTNNIIVAGLSAGAVTGLHLAYMDQDEIANSPFLDFNILGELDYGGGSLNASSKVKAVVAFAGAIHDINWVEAGDIPAIALHSAKDNMLPVDEGPDSIYHELYLYSGIRVSQRLTSLGIQSDYKKYDSTITPAAFTCATANHGSVVTNNGLSAELTNASVNYAIITLYNFFYSSP